MKNSFKKKMIFCLAGAAMAFTATAVGLTFSGEVVADDATVSFVDLQDTYSAGATLEIPQSVAVKYNDTLYAAEKCYIVSPDGSALTGSSFTLDDVGQYTLVLQSTAEGKRISASTTFMVLDGYYAVSNSTSSVSYGELNATYKKKGMTNGVVAELTEGATLTIAEPLNVYAADLVELFSFNLVRMDAAVSYLSIKLVDCYNPDIEIDIQYWKRNSGETYLKAGPKGAGLVGLVSSDNGQYAIGGNTYSRGIFGSNTRSNRTVNGNYNNIKISFENTDDGKIRIWSNTPEHETNPNGDDRLVTEINNDKLYSETFPGFTTGEVMMSITATGFSNVKTARVEIGSLEGRKNDELNTFGYYLDDVAPSIQLNNTTDNSIVAGVATKVPTATAYDASGLNGDVDYTVWYNYADTKARRAVAVSNGTFIADELGTYTVEYRAKDVYGNKASKLLNLSAVKRAATGIDFAISEKVVNPEIGSVADLTGYSLESLCASPTVEIWLTTPNGKTADVTKTANAYSIDYSGTYKVKYIYADTFYEGVYEYEFTSVFGGKPVFEKKSIPVPEYFIAGATYSVEDIKAYIYEGSEKAAADTKAYISYDGGEYQAITADEFTIAEKTSLKLKLAAASDESVYIESAQAGIVSVGYDTDLLDVAKYFVGDLTGVAYSDYTTFTAEKNGSVSMQFVNALLSSKFSISFTIESAQSLAGMDLIFTDYYDHAKTATIALNGGDGDAKTVSINGVSSALPSSWKGSSFVLSYDGTSVDFDGSVSAADFGFTSDLCLLTIRFRKVSKGFSFKLSALCNQSFGSQTSDEVRPLISASLPSIVMGVNEEYTTDIPLAADVLSPAPGKNCYLTVNLVKSGESNVQFFTDKSGKTLNRVSANQNYVVKFTEYGCYTFTYSYTDGAGRTGNLRQLVYVYDLTAPTIAFEKQPTSTIGVKVGSKITPLSVVATDNLTKTKNLVIWTVVYDANGKLAVITKESTFTLTQQGKYTVYIHCKDENGNAAYVKYEIYAE